MKIVYCGCGRFGIESLNTLKASNHELLHIITHPDKQAGRGRKLRANDVAQWAHENGVPAANLEDINSSEGVQLIKKLAPDLLVVIAFGQKISPEIIGILPKGAINVHGSLLPKYRGAAPINWAIINSETETGVSIITLAEKIDTGEILAQAGLKITADDTADIVHDALAKLAAPLLIKTIDEIATGTITYTKQDSSKATKAPKLKKADGIIDFASSAQQIHNKVRGLWPWPAATACFISAQTGRKYPVTIAKTQIACPTGGNDKPGMIDENLNVLCGIGSLKILELKPHGGKLMDFKSFLNSRGTGQGDFFVPFEDRS
jgi:methionyl-tRNA formyltransferase